MPLLDSAADSMRELFPTLPWTIRLSYQGQSRAFGSGPEKVELACKAEGPLRSLARQDLPDFLDRYVSGEVDINGDVYSLVGVRNHIKSPPLWRIDWLGRAWFIATHLLPSSVRRKLVSVSSHYDLPNEFIESYLDKRCRAYSCAIWKAPLDLSSPDDESLEDAQYRKHRVAAEALEIQPDDSFLDVGCGYGYMVHMAESEFGCKKALGITLSQNQVDTGYSKNLQLRHYMELPPEGQFDKIYTCGMISHLDRSEIRQYYRRVYGLLKSGGKVWFHAIIPPGNPWGLNNYTTISGTFSQRYVFPDHYQFPLYLHIKTIEETGFRIRQVYYRYGHYAKTLRHWYRRYVENLPRTRHLITPTIERAWHLYLTYASTMDGQESVLKQILATKD